MIYLTINKQEYSLLNTWSDITINHVVKLLAIPVPDRFKALLMEGKQDDITNTDLLKTFPGYFGQVIYTLSNIPSDVIDRVHAGDRSGIYSTYLKHLLPELLNNAPAAEYRQPVESFTFAGHEFFMPQTKEVFGQSMPLWDQSALTFTEAADLNLAVMDVYQNGMAGAAMFVAVVTRLKGEVYNEDTATDRAKLFGDLPMSDFWKVFFSFRTLSVRSLSSTATLLERQLQENRARLEKLTTPRPTAAMSLRSYGRDWLVNWLRSSRCQYTNFMKY